MRDGTRQAGVRRQAQAPVDPLDDWHGVDAHPPSEERSPADAEPGTSERITLIEFRWSGLTGAQQVILVSREWLQ